MKIVIVGGGPAGIAAALTLCDKHDVVIIEKKERIGGKIPLTGNGRCNLSNLNIDISGYHSISGIDNIAGVFDVFDNDTYKDLLKTCGIYTTVEDDRIYPLSLRADQVRDLLEAKVFEKNIQVITDSEVCDISSSKDLIVSYKKVIDCKNTRKSIICDRVILASGTPAGFKRIKDNNSLYLAGLCGFENVDFEAGLVPLICKNYNKELAGVRSRVRLTYNKIIEEGEIQFTEFGLSGIPAMQLSLTLRNESEGAYSCVNVDFIPELDELEINEWLNKLSDRRINIFVALCGLVNKKIALHILDNALIDMKKNCTKLSDVEKAKILDGLKKTSFYITGKKDISLAQVCLGGISLQQLDNNLSRRDNRRIYAVGEVLDVVGRCGGYNLFFAFASGYSVGMAIKYE